MQEEKTIEAPLVPKIEEPKKKRAAPKKKLADYKVPQTVEEAVSLYNEMVLTAIDVGISRIAPVQKFNDMKTGAEACRRLHESIGRALEPKTAKPKETTMAKKSAKKTGKAKAKKTTAARAKLTADSKITWVAGKTIPFPENGGPWKRSKLVQDNSGLTLKALRAKKVKSGTVRTLIRKGVVRAS